jgi:hypothetical protein
MREKYPSDISQGSTKKAAAEPPHVSPARRRSRREGTDRAPRHGGGGVAAARAERSRAAPERSGGREGAAERSDRRGTAGVSPPRQRRGRHWTIQQNFLFCSSDVPPEAAGSESGGVGLNKNTTFVASSVRLVRTTNERHYGAGKKRGRSPFI